MLSKQGLVEVGNDCIVRNLDTTRLQLAAANRYCFEDGCGVLESNKVQKVEVLSDTGTCLKLQTWPP